MMQLLDALCAAVGVVAALAVAACALVLARGLLATPGSHGRALGAAFVAWLAGSAIVLGIGIGARLVTPYYFIDLSAFALPVLVLLDASAVGGGAATRTRWMLTLLWGAVVFPAAALIPPAVMAGCTSAQCGYQDFAGAVPLFLSSAVFVLPAWLPRGSAVQWSVERSTAREVIAVVIGWIGFDIWLAAMEGALDDYVPGLLLAGVIGPIAGVVAWGVVNLLAQHRMSVEHILCGGLATGMVAMAPGAAALSFPWNAVVALVATAVAVGVHQARPVRDAGAAPRWGLTLLVASAIGLVAPALLGDPAGFIFSAEGIGFVAPIVTLVAVCILALAVSWPVWRLVRRTPAG